MPLQTEYNKDTIKESILNKLLRYYGCTIEDATPKQIYAAVASTVRDQIMLKLRFDKEARRSEKAKRLYYLSIEFLTGRWLHNNLLNLCSTKEYEKAFEELGLTLRGVLHEEPEPALGNGGLGRLAACFLDSLATLNLPAMGCTIRYEYGLFRQRIVDGQQQLFIKRDLRLRFSDDTQGRAAVIDVDADMITQAVVNLMSNAMRYTPEGGWVVVSVRADRRTVQIIVSDTGIGIAKEDLSRIFGRFWRADASRAREAGGLGVGLSVTKQIVERHHGYISVESELGKGTTFTIHLPREHMTEPASSTMEH